MSNAACTVVSAILSIQSKLVVSVLISAAKLAVQLTFFHIAAQSVTSTASYISQEVMSIHLLQTTYHSVVSSFTVGATTLSYVEVDDCNDSSSSLTIQAILSTLIFIIFFSYI